MLYQLSYASAAQTNGEYQKGSTIARSMKASQSTRYRHRAIFSIEVQILHPKRSHSATLLHNLFKIFVNFPSDGLDRGRKPELAHRRAGPSINLARANLKMRQSRREQTFAESPPHRSERVHSWIDRSHAGYLDCLGPAENTPCRSGRAA